MLPLLIGLILLLAGAEALVRGGAALARRLRVGSLLIGLTIVAYGTSAPELSVSAGAALKGSGDIAIGNVVGSNIANVLLIIGLAALIRPLRVKAQAVRVDIPIMIGVSLVATAILAGGRVGRIAGLGLLAGALGYTVLSIRLARRERGSAVLEEYDQGTPRRPRGLAGQIALMTAGLSALLIGARLFVGGAVSMAASLGVSEALVGLTVVAVGTSLPELTTSVVAAARSESDIAVGNVVGSNIFNLLAIVGASAVTRPIRTSGLETVDHLVMLAAALLLLPLARSGWRLGRLEGAALLLAYAAYTYLRAGAALSS